MFNLCMVCEVNDGGNLNRAYNSNEKTGCIAPFSDAFKFNRSQTSHVKSGMKNGEYKRGVK